MGMEGALIYVTEETKEGSRRVRWQEHTYTISKHRNLTMLRCDGREKHTPDPSLITLTATCMMIWW